MLANYLMYILMAVVGIYLIYVGKNIKNMEIKTKYKKENLAKLYPYMGIAFIVAAIASVIIKSTIPHLEVIIPFAMIIILLVLNWKYRR